MMRAYSLLVLGLCAAGTALAGDRTIDRKVAAESHGTVEISNVSGQIEVSGWDNPEVQVQGEMGAGVDRVDVESDHGRTTIKVVVVPNHFRSIDTYLKVHVPRDSELDISGVSADVISTDVQGNLQLKTVSGDVKADVYQGMSEIKTVSGDVALRGHSQGLSASMHISTISGNIRVERAAGDVEATTVSGDLTLQLDTTKMVRVRTTSGDLGFQGKLARGGVVDAETVSGDFVVRAVPEGGLDYEVATFSGDIKNCMGADSQSVSKHGPGKRLTGTVGQAGTDIARVRLKTMSGDVELCNRS